MDVYIAPEVTAVVALHPYLDDADFRSLSIRASLEQQAHTISAAHSRKDRRIAMHIMCWWTGARDRTLDDVLAAAFTLEDARATIAAEYGFDSWGTVDALGEHVADPNFEQTLDVMLAGDVAALEQRLVERPSLATAVSPFGHNATLLHYLGANGVESHRQRTPLNAPELATLLIARGADIHATARMYGGGQTPFALASSSAHPHNAGVADALNHVLSGGAA